MAFEIPTTMKAVVFVEVLSLLHHQLVGTDPCLQKNQVSVKEHPVPNIADDDVLVKTVAVSQNPTDFKRTSSYSLH